MILELELNSKEVDMLRKLHLAYGDVEDAGIAALYLLFSRYHKRGVVEEALKLRQEEKDAAEEDDDIYVD